MEVFYIKQELPINGQIRAKEVQLIGENGEKLGVVDFREALDGEIWSVLHQTHPILCVFL